MMRKLLLLAFVLCAAFCSAQTAVVLAPNPPFISTLSNGNVNSFGCVFTFVSGTTTPLATYTDNTGTTLNSNPVILTAGGTASIWIQAGQSYTFQIKSSGGTNCSSGSTVATVNGIGGGTSSQLTVVPYSATPTFTVTSQNQMFQITLTGNAAALPLAFSGIQAPSYVTFQIFEDSAGSHTFTWPSNVTGGCEINISANQFTLQQFVWNGTAAVATGPCVIGAGPSISVGSIFASSNIDSDGGYQYAGAAPLNHVLLGDGANYVDSATIPYSIVSGAPPALVCADGTTHNITANGTSETPINSCLLSGSINTVGKTFRVTTSFYISPASTYGVSAAIGVGDTSAISGGVFASGTMLVSEPSAATATCTVTATGASGTLLCSYQVNTLIPSATISVINSITLNLTGSVYVGPACTFGTSNVSNTCSSSQLLVEQLN